MKNIKEKFIDLLPKVNICLLGLEGSRALGMAMTDDADRIEAAREGIVIRSRVGDRISFKAISNKYLLNE